MYKVFSMLVIIVSIGVSIFVTIASISIRNYDGRVNDYTIFASVAYLLIYLYMLARKLNATQKAQDGSMSIAFVAFIGMILLVFANIFTCNYIL